METNATPPAKEPTMWDLLKAAREICTCGFWAYAWGSLRNLGAAE